MGTWTATTTTTTIARLLGITTSILSSMQQLTQTNLLFPLPLLGQGMLHPSQLCTFQVPPQRKHLIADSSAICRCLNRKLDQPRSLLPCCLRPFDPVPDQRGKASKFLCLLPPLEAPRFSLRGSLHPRHRLSQVPHIPSTHP